MDCQKNDDDDSPFQLNMDTLQASIFRLSMADLALQQEGNLKARTSRVRDAQPEQRRKLSLSWSSNNINNYCELNTNTATATAINGNKKNKTKKKKLAGTKSVSLESELRSVSVHNLAQSQLSECGLSLRLMPAQDKISPLSPSFQHNSGLAVSPRFNWRQLETAVSGTSEEALLTQLSQLQQAVSSGSLSTIRQLAQGGLDLGLPLRGQTGLYLAVTLHRSDVAREILRQMMKTNNIKRNINMFSVDNASRRETALICAARTGQVDSVRHLVNYGADLELRDGEGHTALWCAVREQREEMVVYLVGRGAKVFYNNNDPSCPLQLACKTPLLKERGQKIACHLVIHGANLEYQDIALRNTLFWVVYNNNRDLAYFIIQCGARVRPWSWVEPSHLPEPLRQDKLLLNMILSACSQPQKLGLICIRSVRKTLSEREGGRSILSAIDRLPCDQDLRRMVRFECASSKREQVIRKLHRLQETTEV